MGLTMKKILNEFSECDMFSLTGRILKYDINLPKEELEREMEKLSLEDRKKYLEQYIVNYRVTEEEIIDALNKVEDYCKEEKRKIYENSKDKFVNYPKFDDLYEEIKKECYEFNSKGEGRFIADCVGSKTKYGNEHRGFFYSLYHDISMNIERQKDKDKYCNKDGMDPLEQIPNEIKKEFLYYEISYFNSVTVSSLPMINYYFKLNNKTKDYLLKFRNDFCLDKLEDLTFYKDGEIKFFSCTHELFNSINFNYKNMSSDDIVDFINDEYYEEDNNKIIDTVNKLIIMKPGTKFSFKEIMVNDDGLMNKVCLICDKINLVLISENNNSYGWSMIDKNCNLKKANQIPAILCNINDIIEKKY